MLKIILCSLMFVTAIQIGSSSGAMARELSTEEKQVIASAVKRVLRDPASASFKWGEIKGEERIDSSNASAVYCGYVNSRNAYGGFVGDKPFSSFTIWVDEKIVSAVLLEIGGTKIQTNAIYDVCGQNGYRLPYFAKIR